jgi:hypothetical protein
MPNVFQFYFRTCLQEALKIIESDLFLPDFSTKMYACMHACMNVICGKKKSHKYSYKIRIIRYYYVSIRS